MIRLLNSNFYKLRHSRGFHILLLLSVAFGTMEFLNLAYGRSEGTGISMSGSVAFFVHLADLRSLILVFAGALSGVLIGEDFATRTIQGEIGAGNSRSSILLGKTIVFMVGLCAMTAIQIFIVLAGTTLVHGFGPVFSWTTHVNMVRAGILFLLQVCACAMVYVLTSVLLMNKATIITVNFVILLLMDGLLQVFSTFSDGVFMFYQKTPLLLSISSSRPTISPSELTSSILIGIATMAMLYLCSHLVFRRCELK